MTDAQIRAAAAATGLSVVEVKKDGADWQVVKDSPLNRRIHLSTPIAISGPAAGDDRLKTKADPTGRLVLGTISNCSGGITPWGTILSGEEGGMDVFAGDYKALARPGAGRAPGLGRGRERRLWRRPARGALNYDKEPNEWMRFDWVVEIDPFDPTAQPVKRTALGRFTHEGAQVAVAPDGRVVVYMGDDDDFEYLYRFVTAKPWNPTDRAANRDLLDEGTLSVARFDADGVLTWLPLVHGSGPLTAENGFASPADMRAEDAHGRRPRRRDADGRAGRLRAASEDRPDLCRDDRERGPAADGRRRRGRAGQPRQSARRPTRTATSSK